MESKSAQKKQFINLTEKIGRDYFCTMINNKIIAKIFTDNLNDYLNQQEEDMDPILNLCSIITRVLTILKELDVKQRAQIESQVLYGSNILSILLKYISRVYTVQTFSMDRIHEHDKIVKKIQKDEEFLSLFCFIIYKRLIVIDDIEFQGKNKTQTYEFIAFQDIRFVSWILNNMAYRIFYNEYNVG